MPLCVYLCYTPGCNTKLSAGCPPPRRARGGAVRVPRCGVVMQCAWTGSQMKTPNLKDVAEIEWRG
jgi:hypothetical protein